MILLIFRQIAKILTKENYIIEIVLSFIIFSYNCKMFMRASSFVEKIVFLVKDKINCRKTRHKMHCEIRS